MKKTLIVLGMTAFMLIGGGLAFAADHTGHTDAPGHPGYHGTGGPGHQEHQGHEAAGHGRDLNFTPDQKDKLKELRWKFEGETAQLKGALLTKRLELRALWRNPKADSKAILDKEKELRDVQSQLREKAVLHRLEVRKILTPEQIEKMGPGWGKGFGRHHMAGEMGEGPGMEHGMGPGQGQGMMGQGMGHGKMGRGMMGGGQGMGHGMGSGMGMCN